MKKLFVCTLACVGLFSCVSDKSDVKTETEMTKEEMQANVENLISTQVVKVEVPDGQMAIVRDEDSTVIATLTKTSNIIVPKGVTTKASSNYNGANITVEFLKQSNTGWNSFWGDNSWTYDCYGENINSLKQTVAFEDDLYAGSSDYDYNDLVFNAVVLIPTQGGEMKMLITPLALGSEFKFQLGFMYNGEKHIITPNDCRTDLFNGDAGFINTEKGVALKKYGLVEKTFTVGALTETSSVDWFITYAGKTIYAVNKFNTEWIDNNMMPYGLALNYVLGSSGGNNTVTHVLNSEGQRLQGTAMCLERDADGTIISTQPLNYKASVNMNSWWCWPTEKTDINKVYTGFKSLIKSGSGTTWKGGIDKIFSLQKACVDGSFAKGLKDGVINPLNGLLSISSPTSVNLDEIKNSPYYNDELYFYFFNGECTSKTSYGQLIYKYFVWFGDKAYTQKDENGYVVVEVIPAWTDEENAKNKEYLAAKYVKGQK